MNRKLRCYSLLSAALLFASSSASGLYAGASHLLDALRIAHGIPAYSGRPTKVFRGARPSRDPQTRGGWWTPTLLRDRTYARLKETKLACLNPFAGCQFEDGPGGGTGPGGGGFGGGGESGGSGLGGMVTSNLGNKITSLSLVGWDSRGSMGVNLSLTHNSLDGQDSDFGHGWNHSYGTKIAYTAGSSAILRTSQGLEVPFTETITGAFTPPAGIHETLVRHTDGTFTLTGKDQSVGEFNAAGYLVAVKDRSQNQVTINRDSSNHITTVVDPSGKALVFSYNTAGRVATVTDPTSRQWQFSYSSGGDLISVTYPLLNGQTPSRTFGYNASHGIVSTTDLRGKVWSWAYDSTGKLASSTNPAAQTWTYSYTSSSATETSPLGKTVTHNYSGGLLASIVDEASYSDARVYDANRNLTSYTDRRGKVWAATYDANGNKLTLTDPAGHVTTNTYNATNDVLSTTDPLGQTTTLTRNAQGSVTATTDPLGHVNTVVYDSFGHVLSATDPLGRSTSNTYDTHGNVTQRTGPDGVATTASYDTLNRITSATHTGLTSSITRDAWGRTLSRTGANGGTSSLTYDGESHVLTSTDALGRVTAFTYNDVGLLSQSTNARGDTTTLAYDGASRLTTITDGNGHTRTHLLTDRGEIQKKTLADGTYEQFSYDASGNIASKTSGTGVVIGYTYDDLGQCTTIDYPTGTDTTFAYDAAGRMTGMVDSTGTSSLTLDAADRLTQLITPQGTTQYGYNNADQRTSMLQVGTGTTTYSYDSAGRAIGLTNPFSETTSASYDTFGRLEKETLANGVTKEFTYAASGGTALVVHKNSSGTVLRTESLTRDLVGNITSKAVDGVTTTYTYDAINQLLSESRSGYAGSYTYDSNGNRLTRTVNGATETYAYDSGDKLLSISGARTASYSYDANGRTAAINSPTGTRTFNWDYESRLTSLTLESGATHSYSYNGLDTRVSRSESGTPEVFKRDGLGVTTPVLAAGATNFTPGVSSRSGATSSFFGTDHHGSVTGEFDAAQAQGISRQYDAFGNLISGPQGLWGFSGAWGYQQDASGYQLLGHRYYDPSTGRFLSRDPAQDGRNWYSYCANNPLMFLDPTGLVSLAAWIDQHLLGGAVEAAGKAYGEWESGTGSGWAAAGKGFIALGRITELAVDIYTGGKGIIKQIGAKGISRLIRNIGVREFTIDLLQDTVDDYGSEDTAQIVKNRLRGVAAERAVLEFAQGIGLDARAETKAKKTPLGLRYPDIGIYAWDSPVVYVEVKSGGAKYGGLQMEKDSFLEPPTLVVRVP